MFSWIWTENELSIPSSDTFLDKKSISSAYLADK